MATQVVELTGDEAALLRSYDRAVQKQAELEAKLRAGGDAGDAAGTQIEAALAKVQRANDSALKGLLGDLKTLGPEGAAAADAMKGHFVDTGKAGYRSFEQILDQIKAIDPAAAEAALAAKNALDNSADVSTLSFGETLRALRNLGPEGTKAARKIEQDMERAAAETVGNFDEILEKLGDLNPVAKASANAIKESMGNAATKTDERLRDLIADMKLLGNEGREAGAQLEQHFKSAGLIAGKSMQTIIAELEKVDPAAAAAAKSIVTNLENSTKKVGTVFETVDSGLQGYANRILTVGAAIQGLSALWQKVKEDQDKALNGLNRTENSDRGLLQVSDNAEQFAALRQQADSLAIKYGLPREQASKLVFDGKSLGFDSAVPKIAEASQILDPEAAAIAGGKVPILFDKEKLSAEKAISGTMVVAKASEADFDTLAKALPKAAEGGRQTGASFASTIAAVGVLTSSFKDVEVASDRIKAFMSNAALKGMQGNFDDIVEELSKLNEADRKKFLGDSQEQNAAYAAALPQLAKIRDQEALVISDAAASDRGQGELNSKLEIANNDPRLKARRSLQGAIVKDEVVALDARGISAASAKEAAARASTEDANAPLGQRIVASKVGEYVSPVLAEYGATTEQSAKLQSSLGSLLGNRLGILNPFAPLVDMYQNSNSQRATKPTDQSQPEAAVPNVQPPAPDRLLQKVDELNGTMKQVLEQNKLIAATNEAMVAPSQATATAVTKAPSVTPALSAQQP